MEKQFKDYFSHGSSDYRTYRPDYPLEVFEYLHGLVSNTSVAWDCACGTGQATAGLARIFKSVFATDASAEQLRHAPALENVTYKQATADDSGIESGTVNLVLVAQALHWFNFDRFYNEVKRVSRKPAIFAALTYGLFTVSPEIDVIVDRFYRETLHGYWAPERRHIDEAYDNIPIPFMDVHRAKFSMEREWTFSEFMGFFTTWSAVQKYRKETKQDPLVELNSSLAEVWGTPNETQTTKWPLTVITAVVI